VSIGIETYDWQHVRVTATSVEPHDIKTRNDTSSTKRRRRAGLPDFSAHNIPKREKMYHIAAKLPKWPKMCQMKVKYYKFPPNIPTKLFHSKALQNLPKLGFLV
jgi:hypothetical protein